jgi:hypothetical protein
VSLEAPRRPRASRIAAADSRDLMAISLAVAPPEER